MIRYVVESALAVSEKVVVVIGYQAEAVKAALVSFPLVRFAVQHEQLGTGHAVNCAMPAVPGSIEDVVVLCGDTPLLRPDTVRGLIDRHRARESLLSFIATTLDNPFGYGRIVLDESGHPVRIVEETDATEREKRIGLINTGAYCVNSGFLKMALRGLKVDNAQGEFYLTDVVEQAYADGNPAVLFEVDDAMQVMGVNTREELAEATRLLVGSNKKGV
jgi:bifunctional N-acetylglucosamine-1-phosphate-uridyltransferase/glucosamine-1-phosphate-acetyltransferase GlmU-like protein